MGNFPNEFMELTLLLKKMNIKIAELDKTARLQRQELERLFKYNNQLTGAGDPGKSHHIQALTGELDFPGGEMIGKENPAGGGDDAQRIIKLVKERFNTIFKMSPLMASLIECDTLKYIDVNDSFLDTLGFSREEVIGYEIYELGHVVSRADIDAIIAQLKKDGYVRDFEMPLKTQDGQLRAGLNYMFMAVIDDIECIISLSSDITEFRNMEKALRDSEANYKAIAESITDIFFAVDDRLRLTYWNKACELMTGISSEQALGKFLPEILTAYKGTAIEKSIFKAISTGEPQFTVSEYFIDGLKSDFEISVYPLRTGISVYARDITRSRLLENEIIRLDQLNLIGEMAASISHEIRNPLTTIKGFLQMLSGQEKYYEDKEYFNLMIEEIDRASSIISEFLSLARNRLFEPQAVNLNTIISNIKPLIEAEAVMNDKHLLLKLGDIPDLCLEEKEIRQLILNLVRNGLEAMQEGKTLTIKTGRENDTVLLSVADQGCGIDASVLEKLGTPFVTTKKTGTGLGLPVCFSIARRHNARIEVETGEKGSTFTVFFKGIIDTLF